MKPLTLIFLTGLTAAGTVHAQSANIYGTLDLGIESLSNVQPAGGRITRMPSNTGILPSRLGMRGKEDLGAGLSAIYTLEMGSSGPFTEPHRDTTTGRACQQTGSQTD